MDIFKKFLVVFMHIVSFWAFSCLINFLRACIQLKGKVPMQSMLFMLVLYGGLTLMTVFFWVAWFNNRNKSTINTVNSAEKTENKIENNFNFNNVCETEVKNSIEIKKEKEIKMSDENNNSTLLKSERKEIENKIKNTGATWFAKVIEWIAIALAIGICFSGGDIAGIALGVCCAIVACYLRLVRIHDTLTIRDLKDELKK